MQRKTIGNFALATLLCGTLVIAAACGDGSQLGDLALSGISPNTQGPPVADLIAPADGETVNSMRFYYTYSPNTTSVQLVVNGRELDPIATPGGQLAITSAGYTGFLPGAKEVTLIPQNANGDGVPTTINVTYDPSANVDDVDPQSTFRNLRLPSHFERTAILDATDRDLAAAVVLVNDVYFATQRADASICEQAPDGRFIECEFSFTVDVEVGSDQEITVFALDALGNRQGWSRTFDVFEAPPADTTPPHGLELRIDNGPVIEPGDRISIFFTGEDNRGIANYRLYDNGRQFHMTGFEPPQDAGGIIIGIGASELTISWDYIDFSPGRHEITLEVCDTSNNCSTIGPEVFTIDIGCDFDGDGECTVADLNELLYAPSSVIQYDLNEDDRVDNHDRDVWLAAAAVAHGRAEPYKLGDTDLDGDVDAVDLNNLGLNWNESVSPSQGWAAGDFNGDGHVSASDLNDLALNWRHGT